MAGITSKSAQVAGNTSARRGAAKAGKSSKTITKPADPAEASRRIDEKIASLGDWRGRILARLRGLIREVDPEVSEDWKWMGTPVWSHDGMYVLANAHKDKVKITFFHGAELPDPKGLFNAGLAGSKWRAIDIREGDEVDEPGLRVLLREAVAYNTEHSVPRSKGSRRKVPGTAQPKAAKRRPRVGEEKPAKSQRAAGKGKRSAATEAEE